VRWTIGDVSAEGFEALGWSIAGAWQMFGGSAGYVVCVNSIAAAEARRLAGDVRADVEWRTSTAAELPAFLLERLDGAFAEGAGWKLAPPRVAEAAHELALDNDCILWAVPDAIRVWLRAESTGCVVAEDVRAGFGQFAALCGDEPRNAGIRGLPAGFSLTDSIDAVLREYPVRLVSELDEQGLQIAAAMRPGRPLVVTNHEVTICSPFPPHQPDVGSCGAHFVGLNAKALPWSSDGQPASDLIRGKWEALKPGVCARIAR
jgi:hypothetical protein